MLYLGSEIARAKGVKIDVRQKHALAVYQDTDRAALSISWDTARAGSIRGRKNSNNIISIVKTDCFVHFFFIVTRLEKFPTLKREFVPIWSIRLSTKKAHISAHAHHSKFNPSADHLLGQGYP